MIEHAWNSINKYMGLIKGKIRFAETIVKEEVMGAYIRQLLIYYGTPLVATKLINARQIDRWEEELYRKLYLLPKDLKRAAIVNTVRRRDPTSEVVTKLARRTRNQSYRQREIPFKKKDDSK